MDITLIVLGSGQDGGVPQLGTTESVARPRFASSVAVVVDGDVFLLDASPDIRHQWASLSTYGVGAVLPSAVFITHAHMGHYTGLVHFGREAADVKAVPLVAPATVLSFLAANEPWATLFDAGHLTPHPCDDVAFSRGDLEIVAVPVPHRDEFGATVAFSVRRAGRPVALYLPDIDGWAAWPDAESVIAAHPVSLLDATFGHPDELPERSLDDIPHPLVTETIRRFGHLTHGRRLVLTHINHSNALGDPDSELARCAVSEGFEIATDGMVIDT